MRKMWLEYICKHPDVKMTKLKRKNKGPVISYSMYRNIFNTELKDVLSFRKSRVDTCQVCDKTNTWLKYLKSLQNHSDNQNQEICELTDLKNSHLRESEARFVSLKYDVTVLASKTNSWIHKLPFDGRVCLEGNKSEAFLVSLEYKAFLWTILVLVSPIAKLTPFLHCNWSAKKDPNQHCPTKQGPATTNSTALAQCWTLSAEWVIACMLTMLKKTQNSALEPQTPPLLINQPTPNAYQLLALCLASHTTPS